MQAEGRPTVQRAVEFCPIPGRILGLRPQWTKPLARSVKIHNLGYEIEGHSTPLQAHCTASNPTCRPRGRHVEDCLRHRRARHSHHRLLEYQYRLDKHSSCMTSSPLSPHSPCQSTHAPIPP